MRQEVGGLVHEVYAQILILDLKMGVHPADQHAACRHAHFPVQRDVPFLPCVGLLTPFGERMRRGGDHPVAVLFGGALRQQTQVGKFTAGIPNQVVGPGADLDLALQVFVGGPAVGQLPAGLHETRVRLGHEVQRPLIDDQVFLFDSDSH